MTVYVDDMMMEATVPNGRRSVSGRWSHLMADTREELDAMADKIGLRRSWIQHPDTPNEHYDVTAPKRAAALRAGAVSLPTRSPEWLAFFEASRRQWTRVCLSCGRPVKVSDDGQRMEHRKATEECLEPSAGPWRRRLADPDPVV